MTQEQFGGVSWRDYDESVVLRVFRYGMPVEHEYDTVEEAVYGAWFSRDHNVAAPDRIVAAKDGRVLLAGAELDAAIEARDRAAWGEDG